MEYNKKEKKKMGRPKEQNPLSIDLKVRITNETNEKLLEYSDKHNITRAEAVRQGIDLIISIDEEK